MRDIGLGGAEIATLIAADVDTSLRLAGELCNVQG